jgi:hypothetical protein
MYWRFFISCLGIIACIVILGCTPIEESQPVGKSNINKKIQEKHDDRTDSARSRLEKTAFNKIDRESFCVTIWTKTTRIQISDPFDVTLRVVNATEKPHSLQVMSCSWNDHWKNNNSRIVWAGGVSIESAGNTTIEIKLEPGEAYEKHVQMAVLDGPRLVTTSFQMGFTPIGEKKTYWSNKVVIGIKPRNHKK